MSALDAVDTRWILICAILVCMMQAGFTAVEDGRVRSKKSINVAVKYLRDFYISRTLSTLVGFGLLFGKSAGGLIGIEPGLAFDSPRRSCWSSFFFRWFCGVASNIMSGAVAERMRFPAYCITAVIISAISYPASGHWVRAGVFTCTSTGWLSQLGFIDFATTTVAHSVRGWVSLAAVLIVGPRVERFSENRRPIDDHDLTNATLGVFWRWFGWFGFNGGNLLAITEKTPIIINTAVGGAVCWYGSSMLERVEIDDAVGACPCICSRVFGARWR